MKSTNLCNLKKGIRLHNAETDPTDFDPDEPFGADQVEAGGVTGMLQNLASGWQPGEFVGLGPESRTLFLTGEIEQIMASAFVSQVQELADLDENLPIIVQINTPGGSATDMLAIYDTLRSVPCPVITVAIGLASSAGCILMQAGDLRLAMPNAEFFWHEAVTIVQPTSPEDFNSHIQSYKKITKIIRKIILERTGMSKKKFKKHFADKTNFTFFAEEALKLGWIDAIETPFDKPTFSTHGELAAHLANTLKD